jgi:hypothetical protein
MGVVKLELQRIAVRVLTRQGIVRPSPLPQKTFIHRLSQLSKPKFMALMGLTLLVVSSIGFFSLVHANQVAIIHANATTTANANATTAAVDASSTAVLSTATVMALTPTVNATATVTGLQNAYYNARHRPPALDDPLHDNSKSNSWEEAINTSGGGTCAFKGGAYHVSESDPNYFQYCTAGPSFSNFVFEVQMKIIKGNAGGVIFRADTSGNDFYGFYVGQDASYGLFFCADNNCKHSIIDSSSPAIILGLNQTNLIALIAQGSAIGLYVNHQLIDSEDDNTYSSGRIGVIAYPIGNPTEVVYSNAKVWTV